MGISDMRLLAKIPLLLYLMDKPIDNIPRACVLNPFNLQFPPPKQGYA